MTPKEQFEQATKNFLVELIGIDQQTKWTEKEPDWWLTMSDIQRSVTEKMQSYYERNKSLTHSTRSIK